MHTHTYQIISLTYIYIYIYIYTLFLIDKCSPTNLIKVNSLLNKK